MTTLMKYSKPQNGILNLFDSFFDDSMFNLDIPVNTIIPDYDIVEKDNEYIVDYALAGFKKENIKLDVDNNILTIEGERTADEEIKYNRKGSFYGHFKKSFTLPQNVIADKIDASFSDGILSIKIPKNEKTKLSKTIKIN
jgi:HSP20 family protein